MDTEKCKEKIIAKCKAEWDQNSALRAEFFHDFDDFLAFKFATLKKSINVSGGTISLSDEHLAGNVLQSWTSDSKLRDEFGSLATYLAYRRARAAGLVRMY